MSTSDDSPPDVPTVPDVPPPGATIGPAYAFADDDADALREWIMRGAGEFQIAMSIDALRRGAPLPPFGPLLPRELMPRQRRGPRGGNAMTPEAFIAKSDEAYRTHRAEFGREPTHADVARCVGYDVKQWGRLARRWHYSPPT